MTAIWLTLLGAAFFAGVIVTRRRNRILPPVKPSHRFAGDDYWRGLRGGHHEHDIWGTDNDRTDKRTE